METVTVSPKYQVVIPKSIRNCLGLRPGEKILMFEKDGVVHLVRMERIQKLRGKFKKLTTEGLRDEGERFAR